MSLTDIQLRNINTSKPLDSKKMADMRALAHFIPYRQAYHTDRNRKSRDSKSLANSFEMPKLPRKHTNDHHVFSISKGKGIKRDAVRTQASPDAGPNKNMQQDNCQRINKSTLGSPNLTNFIKDRKRTSELISAISKQRKRVIEKEIDKNAQMVKIQMQKGRLLSEYQRIQIEHIRRQHRHITKKSSLYERIQSLANKSSHHHLQQTQQRFNPFDLLHRGKKNSLYNQSKLISLRNQDIAL